jgi:hypothetical protein
MTVLQCPSAVLLPALGLILTCTALQQLLADAEHC